MTDMTALGKPQRLTQALLGQGSPRSVRERGRECEEERAKKEWEAVET